MGLGIQIDKNNILFSVCSFSRMVMLMTITMFFILMGNCQGFSGEEYYETRHEYDGLHEKLSYPGFGKIPPAHNLKALQAQLHPQSLEVLRPTRPQPFFSADKSSSSDPPASKNNAGNRSGLIHEANGPLSFVYIAAFLNSIFFHHRSCYHVGTSI